MASTEKRMIPVRVIIVGILSILAGTIYLLPILGIDGIGRFIIMTNEAFQSGPWLLTAFALAIANLILGIGCIIGWRPIWFYLAAISVFNFVVALMNLFNADKQLSESVLIDMALLFMAMYIIFMVFSKKTRAWFRH